MNKHRKIRDMQIKASMRQHFTTTDNDYKTMNSENGKVRETVDLQEIFCPAGGNMNQDDNSGK